MYSFGGIPCDVRHIELVQHPTNQSERNLLPPPLCCAQANDLITLNPSYFAYNPQREWCGSRLTHIERPKLQLHFL